MKTKIVLSAILSIGLITATSAFAQHQYGIPRDGQPNQSWEPRAAQNNQPRVEQNNYPNQYPQQDGRYSGHRRYQQQQDNHFSNRQHYQQQDNRYLGDARSPVMFQNQFGYGPRRDWREGGRIDRRYQNRRYEVRNWRHHQLSAPPYGYHWVNVGSDFFLAAVATDIIMSIVHR